MTKEELLNKTSLFLLDLDGTVYLGDEPIFGVPHALKKLRDLGKRLVFLTNNSSRTAASYREKLSRLGLFERGDEVYTSGMAAMEYLRAHFEGARVYLVATTQVREEFVRGGIRLDEEDPDVCLLAYDTELTFEKIKKLDFFLRSGLPFLATHLDDVCPTPAGPMPDVGSFLAMFERSSHRTPDAIIGKPFSPMGEAILRRYGVERGQACMVGDRLYTDIRFANNNGFSSILTLTGETTREMCEKSVDRPDLTFEALPELVEF